jgi:hypothetical protein
VRANVLGAWLGLTGHVVVLYACSSTSDEIDRVSVDASVDRRATDATLPHPLADASIERDDASADAAGLPDGRDGTSGEDGGGPADVRDAAFDSGLRPHHLWQVYYGRSFAAHVAVDSAGAAIVSGTFFDSEPVVLGGTTLTSKGAADIMLSRVLTGGAVDWARSFGAAAQDHPVSFVVDSDDRITLTGLYNGTGNNGTGNVGGPDFPAFAGTSGRFDVFVAGLSSRGDYRWQTTINTTDDAFPGPGVALNGSAGVFVAGHFKGAATIGSANHSSSGSWDVYFTRFDEPNGALGAALTFGGAGDDRAVAAVKTPSDVLVFGSFHDQVVFPTSPPKTLTSAGGADVFVARISVAGTMSSVVAFGGPGDETVQGARVDSNGSIVVAGDFSSPSLSVFGGAPLANAGGSDAFVARLRGDLSHIWSTRFGGDGDDHVRDLALGPSGEIAVTGEFQNSIEFAPRTHLAVRGSDAGPSAIDIFLAKLSQDGVPVWSLSAGGAAMDRGLGVAMDRVSSVYLVASFQSSTDFGGGDILTPPTGEWGSALVKYAP